MKRFHAFKAPHSGYLVITDSASESLRLMNLRAYLQRSIAARCSVEIPELVGQDTHTIGFGEVPTKFEITKLPLCAVYTRVIADIGNAGTHEVPFFVSDILIDGIGSEYG